MNNIFRKILFSHLFWLDSHLFCRSDFKQNKFECMRSSRALRGSQNHGVTQNWTGKKGVNLAKKGVKIEFSYF